MDNRHMERAQYVLDNNLTIAEAAALLGLDSTTIRKSIKYSGTQMQDKVKAMLAWKKSSIGKTKIEGKQNQVYLYEERAKEIINNPKINSFQQAAKNFGITEDNMGSSVILLRLNNKFLYTKLKDVIDERRLQNRKFMRITNYILKHPKCTRLEVATKFKCTEKSVASAVRELKYRYPDNFKKVSSILKGNKNPKYKRLAQYVIDTNCTYKEAGIKFGMNENTAASNIQLLCRLYEPKMYKTIKQMKAMKSK